MNSVMGLMNLYEEDCLGKLTQNRPLAAVSFAGRYRLIDFALSNMVNAGVQNVGILFRDKMRSLMDHLRSGKEWDLARKRDGLFFLPPQADVAGDAQALSNHIDYLKKCRQEYVVISGTGTIFSMDYDPVFEAHKESGADITVLYHYADESFDFTGETIVTVKDDGMIGDMAIDPFTRTSNAVAMGVYFMKKEFLIALIRDCVAHGGKSLVRDGIIANMKELRVFGYRYDGYVAHINSMLSYYQHSMEVLNEKNWMSLFQDQKVLTKIKDEAPAKYKEQAEVTHAMVANGCIVNGKVENSILFRGVKIEAGAVVKNSILMQRCTVKAGAVLENVICDKNGIITEGRYLKGENNYPLLVEKGVVI